MTETYDITIPTLIEVTSLAGGVFWRQNCGRFRTMDGRRVVNATSIDGLGDIMGAFRGRPVAIETKTKTGPFRKSQKTFREAFEKAGGIYIVARSPADAMTALGEIR